MISTNLHFEMHNLFYSPDNPNLFIGTGGRRSHAALTKMEKVMKL